MYKCYAKMNNKNINKYQNDIIKDLDIDTNLLHV